MVGDASCNYIFFPPRNEAKCSKMMSFVLQDFPKEQPRLRLERLSLWHFLQQNFCTSSLPLFLKKIHNIASGFIISTSVLTKYFPKKKN